MAGRRTPALVAHGCHTETGPVVEFPPCDGAPLREDEPMSQQHSVSFERDTYEFLDPIGQWVERRPTGYATTTCACGLNTGTVPDAVAEQALTDHAAMARPPATLEPRAG